MYVLNVRTITILNQMTMKIPKNNGAGPGSVFHTLGIGCANPQIKMRLTSKGVLFDKTRILV